MRRPFESIAVELRDVSRHHLDETTKHLKRVLFRAKLISKNDKLLVASSSEKSIVWTVTSNGRIPVWVIKQHTQQRNYNDELLGYNILRGGAIPKLIYSNTRKKTLALEYIDGRPPTRSKHDLELIVDTYAQLHTIADQNIQLALDEPATHFSESNLPEEIAEYYKFFPSAKRTHSVSIGDVKHEHVLIKENHAYIIDLDTFSLCRSEWFDVAALQCFLSASYDLDWIIVRYLQSRGLDSGKAVAKSARNYIYYLQNLYYKKSYKGTA